MIRRAKEKKDDRENEREYQNNRNNRNYRGYQRNNRGGRGGYSHTARGRKRQRAEERKEQIAEASSIFETQVQSLLAERERLKAEHDAKIAAESAGKSFDTPPATPKESEPAAE